MCPTANAQSVSPTLASRYETLGFTQSHLERGRLVANLGARCGFTGVGGVVMAFLGVSGAVLGVVFVPAVSGLSWLSDSSESASLLKETKAFGQDWYSSMFDAIKGIKVFNQITGCSITLHRLQALEQVMASKGFILDNMPK
jgi:hypothetical protein